MGNCVSESVSKEDKIKELQLKHWPTEVCSQEQIELLQQTNLETFRQILISKYQKNPVSIFMDLNDYIFIDTCKIVLRQDIREGLDVYLNVPIIVPKKYSNGRDIIFEEQEYIKVTKEVIKVPHIIDIKFTSMHIFIIQ